MPNAAVCRRLPSPAKAAQFLAQPPGRRYRGDVFKTRYLVLAALGLSLSLASAEAAAAQPHDKRAPAAHHAPAHSNARPAHAKASARGQSEIAKGGSAKSASRAARTPKTAAARRRASTTIVAVHTTEGKIGRRSAAGRSQAPKKPPAPPPVPPDSVGHPNEGHLVGGAHLDTSLPYIRVVPSHAAVDARWGLPVFIKMIERGARVVAKRFPGSALDVGDISKKEGGDINGHHSHESGRDADIGFYAVDAKGKQVHAPSFIKFDASLSSPTLPGARFDLARNWLLVQSLLTDPKAHVSHIFIAEPLRQSLLAYARSRGVSRALWVRAAVAMMQPTESLPHDDHIHVRISCPRSMRDTCIELSKNAPSKASRLAKARRPRGHGRVTLKTPRRGQATRPAAHDVRHASPNRPASASDRGATAHAASLSHRANRPAPAVYDAEADADAAEVKDALDESGAAKITD
jgi:penicillin-insensitive murein endopeptidase